jgi:hypothetical protein
MFCSTAVERLRVFTQPKPIGDILRWCGKLRQSIATRRLDSPQNRHVCSTEVYLLRRHSRGVDCERDLPVLPTQYYVTTLTQVGPTTSAARQ